MGVAKPPAQLLATPMMARLPGQLSPWNVGLLLQAMRPAGVLHTIDWLPAGLQACP